MGGSEYNINIKEDLKMKIKDLEEEAKVELEYEDKDMVIDEIKGRLREIRDTERVLKKLKGKYLDFLEADSDGIF